MARHTQAAFLGVLGFPVSHSISPEIFEFLGRRLKRTLHYRRLAVEPARLKGFVQSCRDVPVFRGWNVTIPHKEAVARLVDRLTDEAKLIGAVNVVRQEKNELTGFNTDVVGIAETFREQGQNLKGCGAVLIGAGGAAAAVGYVLGEGRSREVRVFNRDVARARSLCKKLGRHFPRTRYQPESILKLRRWSEPADLYVNATPVGMKGFPAMRYLPLSAPRGALAFDLVYAPPVTAFLADARRRGLRTAGGLDMLLWQALGSWEHWFGRLTATRRNAAKRALKKHMEKRR